MNGTVYIVLLLIAASTSATNKSTKNYYVDDELNWKIVGGYTATQGQFPYIVSLRDASDRHFCGGSIISNKWIITAAHCMVGASPSNLFVVVGTNTLNYGGIRYPVARIIVHSLYDSNFKNDIALLEVANPITYSSRVKPISLGVTKNNEVCTLAGWGSLYLGSASPNNLQYLYMKSLTIQQCQQYLPETDGSQLCTLTQQGQGACHGDSGGPLTSSGRLVGIVSYGRPCANGVPDVYTRVNFFITWINNYVY